MTMSPVIVNPLRLLSAVFVLVTALHAQSVVDLSTQSRNADFSNFPRTRVLKTGTLFPANCQTGELFFKSDAPAGQNIFGCVSPNLWTSQGGGGTANTGLTTVALTSATSLSIGASCSDSNPCNVGLGATVYSFVSAATVNLSGGTGNAYIYIASDGSLTVGHNVSLTCSGACLVVSGVTSFPSDAIPIAIWGATNGAWSTGMDVQAILNKDFVRTGLGLISVSAGYQQISIDETIVPTRAAVPPTATSSCVSSSWAADASFFYICVAPGTWLRVAIAAW